MTARRAVWEVARRELVERSRSRVMRISARSVALEPTIQVQAKAAGRRVRGER